MAEPGRIRLIFAAAALLLPACGPVADDLAREVAVAPSYDQGGPSVKDRLLAGLEPAPAAKAKPEIQDTAINLALRDVVVSVLQNNRDIQVAAHGPDQARAGLGEAWAAYDPEAFAEWQYSRNSNPTKNLAGDDVNNRFSNNTERAGLRQLTPTGGTVSVYREWTDGRDKPKDWPHQNSRGRVNVVEASQPLLKGFWNREVSANIEVSRLQTDLSNETLRQTVLKSVADALETYWNAALAREDVRIYEETLSLAQRLLNRENHRHNGGMSMELDVHRAREAVATRTTNLLYAQDQQQIYQERLKLLLNTPSAQVGTHTVINVAEPLETPLVKADMERSVQAALANRPEMRQAGLAVQTGTIRRDYAGHNVLPRLDLVGSLRDNDRNSSAAVPGYDRDTLGRDWSVGLMFSMPLGNMKARAALERAESELRQVKAEKSNARAVITAEVKTAVKTLELIAQEIPLSQQAVAAARRVADGEWAKLELNQAGNRDLLQAQDLLAVSERSRIQALIRYNIALVNLLAAEGTLLEHLGIVMK